MQLFLFNALVAQKLLEFVAVSVEHVDVNLGRNAAHMSVGAELPVGEAHVGLVS